MTKTSGELEREFIETAKEKTGKDLREWLSLVKFSSIKKRNDLLEWLKRGHGLNHLHAQLIAGIHMNNGEPVYIDQNSLLGNQFAKCPDMRPLFDTVSEKIRSSFPGTQLIPKRTYLSFTEVREFAAVNVKPNQIRLGLDLGDKPFTETLQKSKLKGPMPRISHMVALNYLKQFNQDVMSFITISYTRTHKK